MTDKEVIKHLTKANTDLVNCLNETEQDKISIEEELEQITEYSRRIGNRLSDEQTSVTFWKDKSTRQFVYIEELRTQIDNLLNEAMKDEGRIEDLEAPLKKFQYNNQFGYKHPDWLYEDVDKLLKSKNK